MLSFSVKKQKLERKDSQEVVGGTYNYLYAVFDFSYDWGEVSKNAVFNNCKAKKNFTVPIVENVCLVPWEVIESPNFTVSLYGFTDNKRITSNEIMVPVKGKPYNANNIPSPPPTPTDYEAYVELVNKYKEESDAQYHVINTSTESNIAYEGYNEPVSIGISRYDSVDVATGNVVTEYHLVANLEQLTHQEQDVRTMKELLEKMSKGE